MGDLQHFCLRWNNYQNSITTAFENLRDDEDFIDVTLACDGKTLKAHRVVLSACSPYFRELLKSTPCKHPVIVLQDVVFDDLHALVEFIYHGEVNVHQRNLTSFLKTAEVLKVSGLTQQNTAAPSTPVSSASPSSDHFSENLSTRFSIRSPSTPLDKTSPFQQPSLYGSSNHLQTNAGNEDRNSPRALLAQPQQTRHRRHIRSPTPIRSYSREDSPISLKRAKSADNTSPLLNCSNVLLSPSTLLNEETVSSIRTSKNSCEALPSSRRGSPNEICSNNNDTVSYDENHNDEESANSHVDRHDEDEPPVDFSTNSVKKYNAQSSFSASKRSLSPKNLSIKSEPMDLVANSTNNCLSNNSSHSNNNISSNSNNNNNNKDHNSNNNNSNSSSNSNGNNNNNENDNDTSNFNDDDSNQSEDRLSDQSPPPSTPYPPNLIESDDTFQGHRNYLDSSKLFAAAGASFSFNMAAAALAADSLAGFNQHQNHTNITANAVLDGLTGSSQGLKKVFPCLACGKVLCSKASLKRHVADKHASHQEEYRCAICERVYCSRNSLMTHIYTYHKTRPTLLIPPPHHTTTPTSHATDIKF